jgi:hypothetical protein
VREAAEWLERTDKKAYPRSHFAVLAQTSSTSCGDSSLNNSWCCVAWTMSNLRARAEGKRGVKFKKEKVVGKDAPKRKARRRAAAVLLTPYRGPYRLLK